MDNHNPQLWQAVIERAVLDLRGKKLCRGDDPEFVRQQVRAWIGSEDFHEVCILAGLPAAEVEQRMNAIG